ncbi:MAG: family 11 methyltransferase [Idiomarinaceae bacterium HL-53]|nr:MAG: family 11 methyltransferase [Idiomarinaceae bacterium HL-53]CUS47933.1 Methyltransferase domain-containing protein [Idiomarinaceae bacterium HL-53]
MKHWTQFWQVSNTLSSFAEGKAAKGYDKEVKAYWEAKAENLPNNAVIVDIGTGNGALAVLFNDLKKQKKTDWKIHGVDAAEISPLRLEEESPELKGRFEGIEFHSETDITTMPFEDESVDLVVSQFAFEYAEEKQALNEVLRILKPSGHFALLTHHKKSQVHKTTEDGFEVLEYALGRTPLFMQADLYLRFAAQGLAKLDMKAFQATQEAQAIGKTVEWVAEQIKEKFTKEHYRVWVADVLQRVFGVLRDAQSQEAAIQAGRDLTGHYNMLLGHKLRLKDMLEAAKTEAQVKKFLTAAKKGGAEGEHQAFTVEDEVFAWSIGLTKA